MTTRSGARWTWLGTPLAGLIALAGCECGEPREEPSARRPAQTQGAESRPAVAYPSADPPPPRSAFAPVVGAEAPAALASATRAGGWAALRRGGEERRSAGNFLCRLETLYGRAPIVLPEHVAFVLRDDETGIVLTASADASGPSFAARLPPGEGGPEPTAQTSAAEAVLALATLLDATVPHDCAYELGGREVGVRNGEWF